MLSLVRFYQECRDSRIPTMNDVKGRKGDQEVDVVEVYSPFLLCTCIDEHPHFPFPSCTICVSSYCSLHKLWSINTPYKLSAVLLELSTKISFSHSNQSLHKSHIRILERLSTNRA